MRRLVVSIVMVGLLLPALAWAQEQRSLNSEVAKSLGTTLLGVLYFPLKFSVALIGAPIGGVAGFLTGGNQRAAESIWRPTVGGTYFITPEILEGSEPFLLVDRGVPRPQGREEGTKSMLGY
jgi:hypothetical protein